MFGRIVQPRRGARRNTNQFAPAPVSGAKLLFNAPLRWNADAITAGGVNVIEVPTKESVDAVRTFDNWQDGFVTDATANTGRMEAKGILIEGSNKQNLIRTEEIDNAAWSKSFTTISADQTAAPDGQTTADSMLETTDNGIHQIFRAQSITSGVSYVTSVLLKKDVRIRVRITLSASRFPGAPQITVNVDTGTIVASQDTDDEDIDDFGNGWFRVWFTATASSTGDSTTALRLQEDDGTESYVGVVTSGMFIWGANQGDASKFLTSYTPAIAATVTGAADSLEYA